MISMISPACNICAKCTLATSSTITSILQTSFPGVKETPYYLVHEQVSENYVCTHFDEYNFFLAVKIISDGASQQLMQNIENNEIILQLQKSCFWTNLRCFRSTFYMYLFNFDLYQYLQSIHKNHKLNYCQALKLQLSINNFKCKYLFYVCWSYEQHEILYYCIC